MPAVLSKILSPKRRVYIYAFILLLVSIIHTKLSFDKSNSIEFITSPQIINRIDLVISKIPLFISTFAGIDSIHYLTRMLWVSKSNPINIKTTTFVIVSSILGFVLPLMYSFKKTLPKSDDHDTAPNMLKLRKAVTRVMIRFAIITWMIIGTATALRVFAPAIRYTLISLYFLTSVGTGIGTIGIYFLDTVNAKLKDLVKEQQIVSNVNGLIIRGLNWIKGGIILENVDISGRYMLPTGLLASIVYVYFMDFLASEYFDPYLKTTFLNGTDKKWIYQSYYHYVKDHDCKLSKDTLYEIFGYAEICKNHIDRVSWMRHKMSHDGWFDIPTGLKIYAQELIVVSHFVFAYISYRQICQIFR